MVVNRLFAAFQGIEVLLLSVCDTEAFTSLLNRFVVNPSA